MSYIKAVQEWAIGNDFEHLFQEADGAGNVGFNMSFGENQTPVMVRGYDEPQILQVFVFCNLRRKSQPSVIFSKCLIIFMNLCLLAALH
jgi:hypothetical protein